MHINQKTAGLLQSKRRGLARVSAYCLLTQNPSYQSLSMGRPYRLWACSMEKQWDSFRQGTGPFRRRCISKRKMVFHFRNLFHICIKGLCSFIFNKNKKTKKYKGKFVSRKTAENGLLQLCIKLRGCFLFFIPEKLRRFIVK